MISFDLGNAMASAVGDRDGLSETELNRAVGEHGGLCSEFAGATLAFVKLLKGGGERGLRDFAEEKRDLIRNFVQIGIGGSALGAAAIHTALCHRFHNQLSTKDREFRPRFYLLDNVDPEETHDLIELLDPKETLFHVVTKGGSTTETMAGFLVALKRLKAAAGEKWSRNVAVTTDPEKGFLREFAAKEGLRTFDIPSDVGGRFSVLTPVGLLPAAFLGIDPAELLKGAAEMNELCRGTDARENPAFMVALAAHLLDVAHGKRIHVMMPYVRALRDFADWFRQLWAESLGKKPDVGPTPVVALGTTDQHSQIQLYNDGPNDKYVLFLEAGRFRHDDPIPPSLPDDPRLSYLYGKKVSEVISAMKSGTATALAKKGRPNATLRVDEISARSLGALFFLFEAATWFAGRLYDVDPFDQPGVEEGKKIARGLLGG